MNIELLGEKPAQNFVKCDGIGSVANNGFLICRVDRIDLLEAVSVLAGGKVQEDVGRLPCLRVSHGLELGLVSDLRELEQARPLSVNDIDVFLFFMLIIICAFLLFLLDDITVAMRLTILIILCLKIGRFSRPLDIDRTFVGFVL